MHIRWYDWITPTTPFASAIIGAFLIIFISIVVWLDTKSFVITALTLMAGLVVLSLSVFFLSGIGIFIH